MVIDMKKSKRGWIQILEAFVAVMLVAGVILFLLNSGKFKDNDLSNRIYEAELSILREVQANDSLRAMILDAEEPMPVDWSDARFPSEIKEKINVRTPNYLTCVGKICNITQMCTTTEVEDGDIYSQSISISSTLTSLGYRKLNLFCWVK